MALITECFSHFYKSVYKISVARFALALWFKIVGGGSCFKTIILVVGYTDENLKSQKVKFSHILDYTS